MFNESIVTLSGDLHALTMYCGIQTENHNTHDDSLFLYVEQAI